MSSPRISVAMSVYNTAPYLALAIESILGQSEPDFEFLIVNDGSTDGSGAIIDSFAAADARIRPIHQENRGLVASLNRLVEEARAPIVARMDADDIALPERFARQLAFLEANPDHGVVGAWAACIDEKGAPRPEACPDHPTSHEAFLEKLETGPLLCHPAVMMRREVVRAAGGYHRAYRHCEDYDLWLRLSERTKICSLPERLILYRHSDTQVSSRHVVAQQTGAAIAWEAHRERLAGRPDPTEHLEILPPIEELDRLFGREGVSRAVRSKVAPGIVYSPIALRGEGFDMLIDHVNEGGAKDGLWRTAARLLTIGEPTRALRLAAALASR
jgi:GT2 family glycosyltransferase